jgi:short-subunit dehydrogenase
VNARRAGFSGDPAEGTLVRATPEKVARAILSASKRRKREVYLNWDSKLLMMMKSLSPRFVDWGFERWYRRHADVT